MTENYLPLDVAKISTATGNVYKSIVVIGKRANQLTVTLKEELTRKLAEFAPTHDNLEEVMENKEQIEISRFYEQKPKPVQQAVQAFVNGEVYYRDPHAVTGE